MGVRRALLVALSLLACAAPPAPAAGWPYLRVRVAGAVTARFTITKPTGIAQEITADGPAGWFGYVVTRGSDFVFSTGSGDRSFETNAMTGSFARRDGFSSYVLSPGTYDLTMFSAERRTLSVRFERVPRLAWRAVSMPVARVADPSLLPSWRTQVDLTPARPARGFVALVQQDHVGVTYHATGVCVWRTTQCDELAPDTVEHGGDGLPSNGRRDLDVRTFSGVTVPAGVHHVRIGTVAGGKPMAREALVFVVP